MVYFLASQQQYIIIISPILAHMQRQLPNPATILSKMQTHPYLLNQLTEQYLTTMSSHNHPTTSVWSTIQITMRELSKKDLSIEESLLLFNVLKLIVSETFNHTNGIKDNRMYCWLGMIYGCKIGAIIQLLESMREKVSDGDKDWFRLVCEGLLFSEIVVNLAEKSNRANTSNRVIFPQLYRFINSVLENIPQPKINTTIIHPAQPSQQQTPNNYIKTTKILQTLLSSSSIINKTKQAKSQQSVNKINNLIVCQAIGKIVEILIRSVQLCKKNVIEGMHIVRELINGRMKAMLNQDGEEFDENTLGHVIRSYLQKFESKLQGEKTQQIDEQNKIIQVRQLTPRFADEGLGAQLKKLRTKKKKLIKKLQSDARTAKMNKLQERRVLEDVRNERVARRQKKQIFIMQKQTEQAKKENNKMKRIKNIQKQGKTKSKGKASVSSRSNKKK